MTMTATMTATTFGPSDVRSAASSAIPPATPSAGICDFSDDGRLPHAAAEDRSAWTCPGFYLAVPTCALLMTSVAIIRLYRIMATAFAGGGS